MQEFLPYGAHAVDEDDISAVTAVLRAGMLTGGPKVAELEHDLSRKIGAVETVISANGTTALHLAVLALGITKGDQVIVPSVTFLSTANVVRMLDADVVFCDICPRTGLMTPETLQAAIDRADKGRLKAVMPVWLNGQSQSAKEIYKKAKDHGLKVITDCCHALGAQYVHEGHLGGGRPGDGQFEDIGCFSMHPVKSIAMGEGGACTTNDPLLAETMRSLRSHNMQRSAENWTETALAFDDGEANPWYYEMPALGFNYRASDIQCALGISQLKKLDVFVERRRQLADIYKKSFEGTNLPIELLERSTDCKSAWHLFPIFVDFDAAGMSRRKVMEALKTMNVGTQVHYIPVSSQPYYTALYGDLILPGSEAYYQSALSLPIYPKMTDADARYVVSCLKKLLA